MTIVRIGTFKHAFSDQGVQTRLSQFGVGGYASPKKKVIHNQGLMGSFLKAASPPKSITISQAAPPRLRRCRDLLPSVDPPSRGARDFYVKCFSNRLDNLFYGEASACVRFQKPSHPGTRCFKTFVYPHPPRLVPGWAGPRPRRSPRDARPADLRKQCWIKSWPVFRMISSTLKHPPPPPSLLWPTDK